MTDRQYTDREFNLILRRAFELEQRKPAALPPARGLSLGDIRSIAAEVGLDPATVDRAAALLPDERSGALSKLLGGPEAMSFAMQVDGELDDADYGVVLQVIRRVLRQRGETDRTGDVLDWKSVGSTEQVFVTVTPRAGRTSVDVTANRSPALLLTTFFSALGWAVLAAMVGTAAAPTGSVANVSLFAAAVLGALTTARVLWRRATNRLRSTVEQLTGTLQREITELNSGHRALPDAEATDPDA